MVKHLSTMRETWVRSLAWADLFEPPSGVNGVKPPLHFGDFPGGLDGKASVYNAGDLGSIPGLGRPPEKGKATRSSLLA